MPTPVSTKLPPRMIVYGEPRGGVYLRPLTVFDASAINQAVQESLPQLRQFMPWAHTIQSEETQFERLKNVHASYWAGKDFGMGMFRREDDYFLGGFGLHFRTLNPRALEIGYWVRTSHHKKGLATLGTKLLVCLGFSYFELERIQCGYNTANLASSRVNDKVGFQEECIHKYFEISPTPAMRLNGDLRSASNALRCLLREHIPSLSWYRQILEQMEVFNWKDERVERPSLHNG